MLEKGNAAFRNGEYYEAEDFYTWAVQKQPGAASSQNESET